MRLSVQLFLTATVSSLVSATSVEVVNREESYGVGTFQNLFRSISKRALISDCGTNGKSSGGKCACALGWGGGKCQNKLTKICNGTVLDCGTNGECNSNNTECVCNSGWAGKFCNILLPNATCVEINCGTNGKCNSNNTACECYNGWEGLFCNIESKCADNCTGNGVCDKKTGDCTCNDGYTNQDRCAKKAKYVMLKNIHYKKYLAMSKSNEKTDPVTAVSSASSITKWTLEQSDKSDEYYLNSVANSGYRMNIREDKKSQYDPVYRSNLKDDNSRFKLKMDGSKTTVYSEYSQKYITTRSDSVQQWDDQSDNKGLYQIEWTN